MKKILLLMVTVFLLLVSGCTTSDGGVTTPKIKFAKTFDGVLHVFNENMKCESQEFYLYQEFEDIDNTRLIKVKDGIYSNRTDDVFYSFTDFFGFGEQNLITKIEYKKNFGNDKAPEYSLFGVKIGDHISKLYENMVAAGLMVYIEHNVNFESCNSLFYTPSIPIQYYKTYNYRVGPFYITASVDSHKYTIEHMFVSLEHCDYNVDENGTKIYNYEDGMKYSNDMFLAFPYYEYDNEMFSFSYDFWFPKNEYKIFIYSKANIQKDVENVYYRVPFIDEISICFVKEEGIKKYDPTISNLYLRKPFGQWQGENPTAYDAIPYLDACESYPNFTRVFFYAEDMIKEK